MNSVVWTRAALQAGVLTAVTLLAWLLANLIGSLAAARSDAPGNVNDPVYLLCLAAALLTLGALAAVVTWRLSGCAWDALASIGLFGLISGGAALVGDMELHNYTGEGVSYGLIVASALSAVVGCVLSAMILERHTRAFSR